MEISQTYETLNPPAEARSVYPNKIEALGIFTDKVRSGDVRLEPVGTDQPEFSVAVSQGTDDYRDFDFSATEAGNYKTDEIAKYLPEGQQEAFLQKRGDRVLSSCFNVYSMNNAWWVPTADKDHDSWLDQAKLFGVAIADVADKKVTINDFSGEIDRPEFLDELKLLLDGLAEQGINAAEYFTTVNIVNEDNPRFVVPDHIKAKNPKVFVAAQASARGVLTFNSRTINKEDTSEANGFTVGSNWQETFTHEIGHFLDMGLASGESKTAAGLGWKKRAEVLVDDFGNLQDIRGDNFFGVYVTDDYGKETFVSNSKTSEMLLSDGKKDGTGADVKPPSRYGHENSSEDIAESFAAFMAVGSVRNQLDTIRAEAMRQLVADKANIEPVKHATTIQEFDPHTFRPWDHLLPKAIRYRDAIYHSPLPAWLK